MKTLVCPNTESCIVYRNWREQTGNERLNIILYADKYECMAIEALNDMETGIPKSKELEERLDKDRFVPNCLYIKLLNL